PWPRRHHHADGRAARRGHPPCPAGHAQPRGGRRCRRADGRLDPASLARRQAGRLRDVRRQPQSADARTRPGPGADFSRRVAIMNDAIAEHGATILIVDDEPQVVRLLDRLLRSDGYASIVSTMDPREATRLFDERQPDLVLLDLHMPHLDGYEV